MNKQELIKKYKSYEGVWDAPGAETARQIFLQDLDQLDESQKVTVPQFVADVIEGAKFEDYHLLGAMDTIMTSRRKNLYEWFYDDDNMELFARAWLDGYTVEEEPKYIVKLKNGQPLVKAPLGGKFYFNQNITAGNYKATRKELEEADFGWVFDCEGIEIEEV